MDCTGKKSHYNAIENLASFAALILFAYLSSISKNTTTTAAVAYFWFRAAHNLFYILGLLFSRSLTFTGGWLAQL
ncbi:MAG: MAPEG family protein [Rhodospirillales bacterium]